MFTTNLDHGLLLLALVVGDPGSPDASLELSPLVSDGAVLQRGIDVPVHGRAEPGDDVTVAFDGERYVARSDAEGRWSVELPAHEAGGPYELMVEAGADRIHVRDLMFGDVWICSGQSNMEWIVADSRNADREIAAANDPLIRHFKVARGWSEGPVDELPEAGPWEPADPDYVGGFTAVGYFFARELRKAVDVPIGLIHTSWGGSRIEPWMSAEALGLDEAALEEAMAEERRREQQQHHALRARIGGLPERDEGLVDGYAYWADPGLEDSAWAELRVPGTWEQAGYEGLDGIAWYRTAFELTAEQAGKGVRLGLGMIDDSDISWVNGREVGRTEGWNQPRVYEVPAPVLRPGRNVVAVRVEDTGGGGGIHGSAELLFVEAGGARRPLAEPWKFRVGAVSIDTDDRKNQLPTLLHNAMINPLLAFPIKGVLWYQGESNAYPGDAFAYRDQFIALIRDWRARWGVGDFPFLFVQLANYTAPAEQPGDSDWAMLRESQSAALALPNTAQAVAIDLGEADDIHPRNKQDVGRRLALAARRIAYGEEIVHSGPVYRDYEVRDGRVVIEFDHVGGGLIAQGDGALDGFAIAGPDRRFVWADAAVQGDRVVVWNEAVPEPVAVRYAWANNPERANLYNAAGLPAAPFRTDGW